MSTLIAIGYPDETTATAAGDEAQRLAKDLIIQPDAIAVIRRDVEGKYHVTTNHHAVGGGATWGMFWGLLFGMLFFIPVFGMAIGAGMGALMGKVTKTRHRQAVRGAGPRDGPARARPRCSSSWSRSPRTRPSRPCRQFGGTVLKSSLSKEKRSELQEALHGGDQAAAPTAS